MGSNCKHKCFQNLLLKNVGPLWCFLATSHESLHWYQFLDKSGSPFKYPSAKLPTVWRRPSTSEHPHWVAAASEARVRLASGCCSLFPLGWQFPFVSSSWLASMIKVALHSSGCMVLFHIGANWCGPFDWLYTGQNPEGRQDIEVVPRPALLI